jgi:predicted transcriptional regulator
MDAKKWIKQIEMRQKAIAKERDKLDDVISDMEGLREDCDEAWQYLQNARDALSKLV